MHGLTFRIRVLACGTNACMVGDREIDINSQMQPTPNIWTYFHTLHGAMTLVFKNKGCLYSNDQQQHRALLAQSVDRRRLRAVHDKNALAFRRLTLHALARAVSSGLLLRVFCGLCEDRRLRMQGTRLTSAGSSIFAQSTGTACGQCSSRCSGPAVHIPVAQVFMRYAGSSSRVCALAMHARARGWFAAPCLARMPGQDSCSSCQHESRRREQRDSAPGCSSRVCG